MSSTRMRYDDPQLQEVLAGEYVLGALHGRARRRFEQLMDSRPALRERVIWWERKLTPLAESMPEVQPPDTLLKAIKKRLEPE